MQGVRPLVGTVQLRPFVVHANACQARHRVEWITFVRPPAINAKRKVLAMRIPIAGDLGLIETRETARIVDCSAQRARQDYSVQGDFEVQRVKLNQDFLRLIEDTLVELERAVFGVPSRGAEAGPQVNECIAG